MENYFYKIFHNNLSISGALDLQIKIRKMDQKTGSLRIKDKNYFYN